MTTSTAAKNNGTINCTITWKNMDPISKMIANRTMNETTRGTESSFLEIQETGYGREELGRGL